MTYVFEFRQPPFQPRPSIEIGKSPVCPFSFTWLWFGFWIVRPALVEFALGKWEWPQSNGAVLRSMDDLQGAIERGEIAGDFSR